MNRIGDTGTRILLHLTSSRPPWTVSELCEVTGRNRTSVYFAMVRLRNRNLVAWEPGKAGTLHPLVERAEPRKESR